MPDRVALITGAGRGIGAATARRLASAAWRLVLVDAGRDMPVLSYRPAAPEELATVVRDCGGDERAIGVHGDVRSQADLDAAVGVAVERFGGLDAAVAVAGAIAGGQEAWHTTDELWETMIAVNLEGVWRLARASVPALLARPEPRQGRFVAVSSTAGRLGVPLLSAYAAAKNGVVGFIRSLAVELGPYGVTANAIAPGPTRTSSLDASAMLYGLGDMEEFAAQHPLRRLIDPDEVASLLAWICGPDTGAMTGAVVAVDGGMTAA
jgi:SDR family mycofactocin-dependent oxidoreductase